MYDHSFVRDVPLDRLNTFGFRGLFELNVFCKSVTLFLITYFFLLSRANCISTTSGTI